MGKRLIAINEKNSGKRIAEAVESDGALLFEGAWYFDQDKVAMDHLVITERTYICPYKGICYWIDLDAPDKKAKDVGFSYFDVKLGYEFIQNKIGFYAGEREATVQSSAGVENV